MKKKFLSAISVTLSFIMTLQICASAGTIRIDKYTNGEKTSEYIGEASEYTDFDASFFNFDKFGFCVLIDFDSTDTYYAYPQSDGDGNTFVANTTRKKTNTIYQSVSGMSISSNIKLNGVNVGEGGIRIIDNANLECGITATNESESEQKLSVILATYTSDGALYQVKTADIAVEGSSVGNAGITYRFDTEHESTGKLMFWNSTDGMIPIKTVVDFSCMSGVNAYYYDSDNRLLQIDKANGTSIFYTYDKMGNMLTKRVSGGEAQ